MYRILCAYDQSTGADKAFDFALALAKRMRAAVLVLAVFEPAEASRGVKSEAVLQTARHQFASSFELLGDKARAAGVELDTEVAVGSPAQQILKRAEELRADHIIVGQRGKTSRSAVGSVSLRVVTHSLGTVTVVR